MALLVTFPGRYGDLLWALPTVRALAEQQGAPVDLAIAGEFASIVPLLQQQPYLRSVHALPEWALTPPDEWRAPIDIKGTDWDEVRDLGYRGWPSQALPYAIAAQAGVAINLTRPWITVTQPAPPTDLAVGFTEAWFELKLGLVHAALETWVPDLPYVCLTPPGSRWMQEARGIPRVAGGWVEMAGIVRNADLLFGDCSALHVLACAIGTPVVICEPMEARWNPIFYPYGMTGPAVTVVTGHDGRPTFDARHCAEILRERLHG